MDSILAQVQDVLLRKRASSLRVGAARNAFAALTPQEREEFLTYALEQLALPGGITPETPRMTLRDAILAALRDGRALSAADLHDEVLQVLPFAKKNSVASVVTELKRQGVIVRREQGPRGALYALAETPPNPAQTP